jgi:2-amino-4-hydroxy-6-hydroxymethyldihydropteridine diphosphokinase
MTECYLMLGSNLGNKLENIEQSLKLIEELIGRIANKSSLYESEAWGYSDSLSYYNMAVCAHTDLSAFELLRCCQLIEDRLGRVRTTKVYQARTIDIDILFYNKQIINEKQLIIPHPHIAKRRFVLEPMCEIDPLLVHPLTGMKLEEHLKLCEDKCWVNLTSF